MENAYRNIIYFFGAVLLLVFVAFFKTYFGLFPGFAGTATLIHVHVVTILLWFALLIIQPILIVQKKVGLHRLLGKFSYGLMPFLVILLVIVLKSGQLHEKHLGIFAGNILDISLLVLFYGLAITYRHKVAYHARFMILTVLPFLGPALGRLPQIPLPPGVAHLLIIGGLLLYERFHRKIYKPYVISLLVFLGLFIPLLCLYLFGQSTLNSLWEACFG
ncbi:hypothetical protein GO730_29480 [Spirosoma sp. HMF3257]|uniref:DUF2306 domain-containing protein n=1 Tax=Spirosoma telluris TaxID=2183553 RepID=A0A327NS40_9BACT|nr:hypothetical protein [Spirosoma telluris]RAI77269.1 hypothetical protein HMF3257_29385 [Spirosoma telluris]